MYVSIDVTKSGIDRGTHEVKVIINNVINIIEIIFSLVSSAGGFIAWLGGGAALSLLSFPPSSCVHIIPVTTFSSSSSRRV